MIFANRRCLLMAALATALMGSAAARAAAELTLDVTRLDGTVFRGELRQAGPVLLFQTARGEEALAWEDILSLTPIREPSAAPPPQPGEFPLRINLSDGASILARLVEDDGGGNPTIAFGDGLAARLQPSAIHSIIVTRVTDPARAQIAKMLAEPDPPQDMVVAAQGDRVVMLNGRLAGLSHAHVSFNWNDREVRLPWDRVAAIRLARTTARGASCRIALLGEQTLAGRVLSADADRLTLQSGTLGKLELPWNDILRIDCAGDRLTFLSSLKPTQYEFTPWFHKRWQYALDRTLLGGPIRLGGRTYSHGVAMHSRAVLTYSIGGAFRQFAATAGVPDEMDTRGRVDMFVVGDGRKLWEALDVRGGQPPLDVLVDVAGVRELALVVDYGEDLDLSDHAVWAMARLIK